MFPMNIQGGSQFLQQNPQISQLLQNPLVAQFAQQNPQIIQSIQQNPQLAQMIQNPQFASQIPQLLASFG